MQQPLRTTALISLALCAAACSPMTYGPRGETGGGYSQTQLAPHVFDVHYRGSGTYDPERLADFLLLRSAELCNVAGYDYFEQRALVDQTAIDNNSWLPVAPLIPASMTRTVCFTQPGPNPDVRLSSDFVAGKLREKYQLTP